MFQGLGVFAPCLQLKVTLSLFVFHGGCREMTALSFTRAPAPQLKATLSLSLFHGGCREMTT